MLLGCKFTFAPTLKRTIIIQKKVNVIDTIKNKSHDKNIK
jgi:hypothetical protein